jgi:O-antigen/teichoic acid export membrane protein
MVFYGLKYTKAPTYLSIHSANFLLASLSLVSGSFFDGIGRTDISIKAALIQLPTVISLSLPLTSFYGVAGLMSSGEGATAISTIVPISHLARVGRREYGLEFDSRARSRISSTSAETWAGSPSYPARHLPMKKECYVFLW